MNSFLAIVLQIISQLVVLFFFAAGGGLLYQANEKSRTIYDSYGEYKIIDYYNYSLGTLCLLIGIYLLYKIIPSKSKESGTLLLAFKVIAVFIVVFYLLNTFVPYLMG